MKYPFWRFVRKWPPPFLITRQHHIRGASESPKEPVLHHGIEKDNKNDKESYMMNNIAPPTKSSSQIETFCRGSTF